MLRDTRYKGFWRIVGLQVAAAAMVLSLFSPNSAIGAGQILDDFVTTQVVSTLVTGPPGSSSVVSPNTCVGNTREFWVQKDGGGGAIAVTDQTNVSVPFPHFFSFSIGSTGTGQGRITYTGNPANSDPTTAGGRALALNLLTGVESATAFTLNVVQLDDTIPVIVTVWKTDGTSTSHTYTLTTTGLLTMPFTDFPGYAGIFNDIGAIRLNWLYDNPLIAFDMSFETFATICDIAPPKLLTFTATPAIVAPGETTNLCWTYAVDSGPVTSQTIDQAVGSVPVGTYCKSVTVPSVPLTYTLTVANECASASRQVTVGQPPSKVPSLTEWGTILLSLILAVSAVVLLRRRQSVS